MINQSGSICPDYFSVLAGNSELQRAFTCLQF